MSSTEAEVMAINDMVCQICYIRKLFEPLGLDLTRLIMLYNDNQSVIRIVTEATGKIYHRVLKHTDIKIAKLLTKELTKAKLRGLLPRIRLKDAEW
jgi:hypothetical protein